MTKKLNEEAIQNELNESAFFQKNIPMDHPVDEFTQEKSKPSEPTNDPSFEKKIDIPKDRTNERSNERSEKRLKIRHTFDIFEDQLMALHTIQLTSMQKTLYKPKLGDMVQEALDMYLNAKRSNPDHSNEPTNERGNEQI